MNKIATFQAKRTKPLILLFDLETKGRPREKEKDQDRLEERIDRFKSTFVFRMTKKDTTPTHGTKATNGTTTNKTGNKIRNRRKSPQYHRPSLTNLMENSRPILRQKFPSILRTRNIQYTLPQDPHIKNTPER